MIGVFRRLQAWGVRNAHDMSPSRDADSWLFAADPRFTAPKQGARCRHCPTFSSMPD